MHAFLRPAVTTVLLFTLLLGLAIPLAFTGMAGVAFPTQAGGSLVLREGRVIGSALIGQEFAGPRYFHPRPSATSPEPYNAASSAASQLGPTSAALLDAVKERVAAGGGGPLPADAATASASGLDPDISPENAARQMARVAAARGLPEARVAALVAQHVEGPQLGLLGAARVNLLRLNLALDALR
jgi:K+-transporting ATPase ATPase C chain